MNEEKPKTETLWYVGENYANGYHRKPVQSDKVYIVELYPSQLSTRGEQLWAVKASWGRRGKALQSQIKVGASKYYVAEYEFNDLIGKKMDKGYKKWEFVTEVEEMHVESGWDA